MSSFSRLALQILLTADWVIHCSNFGWEKFLQKAPPGAILVKASSVAQFDNPAPFVDQRGVEVLHLVPAAQKVTEEEWALIFRTLISEEERNLLHGGSLSRRVTELFFVEESPMLSALAVLCTGYLLAPDLHRTSVEEPVWWECLWTRRQQLNNKAFDVWWNETVVREWGNDAKYTHLLVPVRRLLELIVDKRRPIDVQTVRAAALALRERLT